ncbi:MAG: DUF1571 domain-containing protein [Pirellulaceae bacterium]|nr:DUF1571 domain-containing protein [Pirellulaceae bacterium]
MFRMQIAIFTTLLAPAALGAAPTDEHPLLPVLRLAFEGYQRMDGEINDYTCVLTKRERVDGYLRGQETMFVKVRHQQVENGRVVTPFSVYLRFLSPAKVKGREVLYVHGKNNGMLIVRNGGTRFAYITTALPPDSSAALQDNRYPITEIGVKNLTRRLIENGEDELQYKDVSVRTLPGAKINNRPCTMIQVSHPERREGLPYQFARIFVDDELRLAVRYSAYDWPKEDGEEPLLIEEYTYTHIKTNAGLADWDFDHRNEKYQFLKSFRPHGGQAVRASRSDRVGG